MIQDIINALPNLENRVELRHGVHIPDPFLKKIEESLLLYPKYEAAVPQAYPADNVEAMEIGRRVRDCVEAEYNKMLLRIGITTLHVKSDDKSVDSVVLMYMGNAREIKITGTPASAHTVDNVAMVTLLENGIAVGFYFIPGAGVIANWFPDGKEEYATFPYPKNILEVKRNFSKVISTDPKGFYLHSSIQTTRGGIILPHIVMLAVDTYNKSIEKNN